MCNKVALGIVVGYTPQASLANAVLTFFGGPSCKSSYWKVEAGLSELKVNLASQVEGIMGYLKPCLKTILKHSLHPRSHVSILEFVPFSLYKSFILERKKTGCDLSEDLEDLVIQIFLLLG